jgi:hypothetical protein
MQANWPGCAVLALTAKSFLVSRFCSSVHIHVAHHVLRGLCRHSRPCGEQEPALRGLREGEARIEIW